MKNKHSNKRINRLVGLANTLSKSKTKHIGNVLETDRKTNIKITFVRG